MDMNEWMKYYLISADLIFNTDIINVCREIIFNYVKSQAIPFIRGSCFSESKSQLSDSDVMRHTNFSIPNNFFEFEAGYQTQEMTTSLFINIINTCCIANCKASIYFQYVSNHRLISANEWLNGMEWTGEKINLASTRLLLYSWYTNTGVFMTFT